MQCNEKKWTGMYKLLITFQLRVSTVGLWLFISHNTEELITCYKNAGLSIRYFVCGNKLSKVKHNYILINNTEKERIGYSNKYYNVEQDLDMCHDAWI